MQEHSRFGWSSLPNAHLRLLVEDRHILVVVARLVERQRDHVVGNDQRDCNLQNHVQLATMLYCLLERER